MKYSFLFVIVLILISGFIAYYGDLLGRKMGKRRLTIFNLRPRSTAILFTVITGMIIASLALMALVAANAQFRKVLIHGEAIIAQNDLLQRNNRDLTATNEQLVDEGKMLTLDVEQKEKDAEKAKKTAAEFLEARNKAQATVQKLEADITKRKTELEKLKSDSKVTKKQLQDSEKQLESVSSALDAAKEKLQKTEEQYVSASMDLRSGILIAKQGDEIVRGVIKTSQAQIVVGNDIRKLLDRASDRALIVGAAKGSNKRAVTVIFRSKISDNIDYLMRNEAVFINKASETIAKAAAYDEVLVQIICARNTLRGEQVPVELKLYPNTVIFREGQKITSTVIDGSQSEGRILMNLTAFLQSAVGWNALQAGVVPISGTFPKVNGDENSLGQVEALMETVDRIKNVGGQVQVTVYAAKDIRAEGPLNMSNMRVDAHRML